MAPCGQTPAQNPRPQIRENTSGSEKNAITASGTAYPGSARPSATFWIEPIAHTHPRRQKPKYASETIDRITIPVLDRFFRLSHDATPSPAMSTATSSQPVPCGSGAGTMNSGTTCPSENSGGGNRSAPNAGSRPAITSNKAAAIQTTRIIEPSRPFRARDRVFPPAVAQRPAPDRRSRSRRCCS